MESSKTNRPITEKEITQMRRSHLILIPVILITGMVIYVLLWVQSIPQPAKWAGFVISALVPIIFITKQYKLEKDLKNGIVEELVGLVTQKKKLGTSKHSAPGGIGRRGNSSTSGVTYIVQIDGTNFWVKPKFYTQAIEGKYVKMIHFPKSQYVVSLDVI